MESWASGCDDRGEEPVTVDLLADLQAGLLDDQLATWLRQRARAEPDIASQLVALDRVRRDVAALGADSASAGGVPADVTARIGTSLRAQPAPAGIGTRPSRLRDAAAMLGIAAFVALGAVGTTTLGRSGVDGTSSAGRVATQAGFSRAADGLALTDGQLIAVVSQPPISAHSPIRSAGRPVSAVSVIRVPRRYSGLGPST